MARDLLLDALRDAERLLGQYAIMAAHGRLQELQRRLKTLAVVFVDGEPIVPLYDPSEEETDVPPTTH